MGWDLLVITPQLVKVIGLSRVAGLFLCYNLPHAEDSKILLHPKFIIVFVIPAIIEGIFVYNRIPLNQFVVFVIGLIILGSIWGIFATRHGKRDSVWLWQFNLEDTLGFRIFDLPVEEYVFYIASGTYIVLTWEVIKFTLESNNVILFILLPFCAIWSALFATIPYLILKNKNDKI